MDDDEETPLLLLAEGLRFPVKRVIAIDVDAQELLVVSHEAYVARDFSAVERVPFTEALWIP